MKVTLETKAIEDIDSIRDAFPKTPFITLSESKGSTFGLSGEEVAAFIFVTLGGGVLTNAVYDLAKTYFIESINRLRLSLAKRSVPIKITVNGISFKLETEEDVDPILEAIIDGLEEQKRT